MTHVFNGVTLFCDDLREEKTEMNTLVGIYPDNVMVGSAPFAFPKLALYTRLVVTSDFDVEPIELVLMTGGDAERSLTTIPIELIEKAITDAKRDGSATAGLISRAMFAPFPVETATRFRVVARSKSYKIDTGTLNVVVGERAPTSPTA